ncbi:MAG: GlxA family transcriptional regulator [Paracoccaceae bacterium]
MQNWSNPNAAAQQIDILLFDDFSALCLANTVEPLRAANGFLSKSKYHWRFLTLDGQPAISSSRMSVAADGDLASGSGDMLIAMPSYRFRDHDTVSARRTLRSAAQRYKVMGGFDTGSWMLAAAGLLDSHRATIHWDELTTFAETFPDVQALREDFVQDQDRLTCRGATAAFDLMLQLIGVMHGHAIRLDVASLLAAAEDYGPQQRQPLARSRSVARALSVMQNNIETPLNIGEIARVCGRSQRDLQSRFTKELGTTPFVVYRRMRLSVARNLLRDSVIPISEIAVRCGYENPSAMTRAFRAEFGVSPQDVRRDLT